MPRTSFRRYYAPRSAAGVLGAALARLEVAAGINAALDRHQTIALTDDPGSKQTASLLTHAYVHLPRHLS